MSRLTSNLTINFACAAIWAGLFVVDGDWVSLVAAFVIAWLGLLLHWWARRKWKFKVGDYVEDSDYGYRGTVVNVFEDSEGWPRVRYYVEHSPPLPPGLVPKLYSPRMDYMRRVPGGPW